jgi:DHA3 family macrolide efflux protein-like MFS transporter
MDDPPVGGPSTTGSPCPGNPYPGNPLMSRPLSGMRGFVIFWFGQMVSLLGTNMSGFGLTIWAYEKTGSATALALVGFFFITPMLIISPVAGALVDRSNRKFMMMISDLASGLATIAILILYATGKLQIWHIYIANAFSGTFQAFQWPAFSAAIATMLPKEQYGRADGMMSLAGTGSGIFAPLLAGALLGVIGLGGILTIDILTFIFAIGALLFVHVPQPQVTEAGRESRGSLWKESVYGFHYILKRPSLLGLQLVFMTGNFITGIAFAVEAAMILARTGNNEMVFGTVSSAGAIGGLIGGLAMSAWGGPKRRVHGVLAGWALAGLLGTTLFGLGQELVVWAIAAFLGTFMTPFIDGSNQAIWQAKVAPDVQGRVFSTRRLVAWFTTPLALLIAGPLADKVMEPAMAQGGAVAKIYTPLVGSGPGSGMAVIFIWAGIGAMLVGLGGYAFRAIRDVEEILPDHS